MTGDAGYFLLPPPFFSFNLLYSEPTVSRTVNQNVTKCDSEITESINKKVPWRKKIQEVVDMENLIAVTSHADKISKFNHTTT